MVRRMRFVDGNATGETTDGGGGGAIFARGGRLTIIDSTFVDNRCDRTGRTSAAAPYGCSTSTATGPSSYAARPSPAAGAATVRR